MKIRKIKNKIEKYFVKQIKKLRINRFVIIIQIIQKKIREQNKLFF